MEKIYYVYLLKVKETDEIFYVGKTFVGSKRLQNHFKESRTAKTLKANKIRKERSRKNTIIEHIVFHTNDEQLAYAKEQQLIQEYGRIDLGTGILCNHTNGGEGRNNSPISKDIRQKISNTLKNKPRVLHISNTELSNKLKIAWKTKRKNFKHSDKTKKYISSIQRKPVKMLDTFNNKELIFNSLYDAVDETKLSIHSIRDNLCGKILLVRKRYKFTYA